MMKFNLNTRILARNTVALALGTVALAVQGVPDTYPSFQEISGLIESNLVGASAEEVNRLSVQGLLNELAPRVSLSDTADPAFMNDGASSSVTDAKVLRTSVGYIKFDLVEPGAAEEALTAYRSLMNSNRLTGLVLDLRDAKGDDYASALKVVDLFLAEERDLMNWGEGLKRSGPKDDAIALPVAVLVDSGTGGSAEALAAVLRQSGVALIIGGRTSGTAGIKRAFPLENGQFLRVTVSNVQLADARVIPIDGLTPDVEVKSEPAVAAVVSPLSADHGLESTNAAGAARMTRLDEADLVRRWRGEMLSSADLQQAPREVAPEERDAVLVRALDLMEGLAILQR